MLKVKFNSLIAVSSLVLVFSTPVVSMAGKLPKQTSSDRSFFDKDEFQEYKKDLIEPLGNKTLKTEFNNKIRDTFKDLKSVNISPDHKIIKVKTNNSGFSIVRRDSDGDYKGLIVKVDNDGRVVQQTFNTNTLYNTSIVTTPDGLKYAQRTIDTSAKISGETRYYDKTVETKNLPYDEDIYARRVTMGKNQRIEEDKWGNKQIVTFKKTSYNPMSTRDFIIKGNVDGVPRRLSIQFESYNNNNFKNNRALTMNSFELPRDIEGVILGAEVKYYNDEYSELLVTVLNSKNELTDYSFKLTLESSGKYEGATDVLKIHNHITREIPSLSSRNLYRVDEEVIHQARKSVDTNKNGVEIDIGGSANQ